MEAETVFKFLELNEKIKNMGLILKAFWRLRFHVCEGSLKIKCKKTMKIN